MPPHSLSAVVTSERNTNSTSSSRIKLIRSAQGNISREYHPLTATTGVSITLIGEPSQGEFPSSIRSRVARSTQENFGSQPRVIHQSFYQHYNPLPLCSSSTSPWVFWLSVRPSTGQRPSLSPNIFDTMVSPSSCTLGTGGKMWAERACCGVMRWVESVFDSRLREAFCLLRLMPDRVHGRIVQRYRKDGFVESPPD